MRRVVPSLAVLMIALAVACNQDPETSRLAPGAEAVLVEPGGDDEIPVETKPGEGTLELGLVLAKAGTRAVVVEDGGQDAGGDRPVKINISDGQNAGTVGTVARKLLRPVAR